jgi:hypothetical protein
MLTSGTAGGPRGFAQRLPWVATPVALRAQVERICGSAVIGSEDVHGGMSPGPAAILHLADGRRVFVKAVSRQASAGSHGAYAREAATLAAMPAEAPAPTLYGCADVDGWLALVMSAAAGKPAGPPWTAGSVRLVAAACDTIAALPAPQSVPVISDLLTDLDGWHKLAAGDGAALDGWELRRAASLANLAADWRGWTAGAALVHQDIRADNAVVDHAAGRATLVDWSYGCAGANWLDRARLAADVVGTGHQDGPSAAVRAAVDILASLPQGAARFVVALAGMWRYRSTLPPLPGHPTLRPWQYQRALALRPLLATLL